MITVTLGPAITQPILRKQIGLAVVLILVSTIAALILQHWGWLAVGGGLIICQGAILMANRLLRLRPGHADDPIPPFTLPGGRVNMAAHDEATNRVVDHFAATIGLWLIVVGTLISSVAAFVLSNYLSLN